MSVTHRYREAWEGFWNEATGEPGEVFWDAEPALTAGPHLAIYEPYVDAPALPLLDLGCGNGTQTRFLADRFPRVVGVDLSSAAIKLAERREKHESELRRTRAERREKASGGSGPTPGAHKAGGPVPSGEIRFRQLDAVDPEAVARLHGELGDCNVYMRGVLHQSDPKDRRPLAEAIAVLIGERGRAFVVELAEAAGPRLARLAQAEPGPPAKLLPVFRHGIVPGAVPDSEVADLVRAAGLSVLASGELPLTTTEYEENGSRIELPSIWLIVGRGA
ncbi:class I SAM-dependent methyltransferase [Streptomyces sp. NPDC051018]|uniref:class I SAM-dependent methyltransferase n=1 Tax=Streptomyces sp. NPDC051018 TaxID=3365639 RepID=UPI0037AE7631